MPHYKMRRERISRLMSSCEPMNHACKASRRSRTTSRRRRPARHSKSTWRSFRIPMPECRCGFPKAWQNSSSASKASARSAFDSSCSWSMSPAVSSNDFFKFFEGGMFDREFVAAQDFLLESKLRGFDRSVCLLPRDAILFPEVFVVDWHFVGVARGPHFDGPKRNDCRAGNNANVFAFDRGSQPLPQVLLRLSDGERLHIVHIAAFCGLNQVLLFP